MSASAARKTAEIFEFKPRAAAGRPPPPPPGPPGPPGGGRADPPSRRNNPMWPFYEQLLRIGFLAAGGPGIWSRLYGKEWKQSWPPFVGALPEGAVVVDKDQLNAFVGQVGAQAEARAEARAGASTQGPPPAHAYVLLIEDPERGQQLEVHSTAHMAGAAAAKFIWARGPEFGMTTLTALASWQEAVKADPGARFAHNPVVGTKISITYHKLKADGDDR